MTFSDRTPSEPCEKDKHMNEIILITGANIGLGKETARQFALKPETKK